MVNALKLAKIVKQSKFKETKTYGQAGSKKKQVFSDTVMNKIFETNEFLFSRSFSLVVKN